MALSTTTRMAAIAVLTLLLPVSAALAHSAAKGPNGGALVQVDDKHLELLATQQGLTVYISDIKHEPITTVGASGRAIVQADGKTATLTLTASGPNSLSGKSEAPLGKDTRVVVTAILAGGTNLQARFVLP
jgi:hypothetical protein